MCAKVIASVRRFGQARICRHMYQATAAHIHTIAPGVCMILPRNILRSRIHTRSYTQGSVVLRLCSFLAARSRLLYR
jgi:hypothetical protein